MNKTTISRIFVTGLLFVMPILLIVAIITWAISSAELLLAQPLKFIVPDAIHFPDMEILVALILIYLIGLAIHGRVLNLLFSSLLRILNRLPVISAIYPNIKEMIDFISGAKDGDLTRVVLVNMPNKLRLIGFVTQQETGISDPGGDPTVAVYLPMSYQMGGYLIYAPESELETLDIPKKEAMQRILTADISGSKTDIDYSEVEV